MKHSAPGYILVLTLLLISVSTIIVTRLVNSIIAHTNQASLFIAREKAQMLALSGISLAMSELSPTIEEKDSKNEDLIFQKNVKIYLDNANRWHSYTLKENVDGIDGEISLYIANEAGKININQLFNHKEKKFIISPQQKKMIQRMSEKLQPLTKNKNLYESFEKFLNKKMELLNDISELITIDGMEIPLYVQKDTQDKNKNILALTDIFTLETKNAQVNALMLSQSLGALMGLKQLSSEPEKRSKIIEDITKKIKKSMNWQSDWDPTAGQLYGVVWKEIPEDFKFLFSQSIDLDLFSVISYGTYDSVTQKVYAIIEKQKIERGTASMFVIRKIIWFS